MVNIGLSNQLQDDIRSTYNKLIGRNIEQDELNQFLQQISHSLIHGVMNDLYMNVLKEKNKAI